MKAAAILLLLGVSSIGTAVLAQVSATPGAEADERPDSMPSSTSGPDFMRSPVWIGQSHFVNRQYAELEAVVRKYAESDARSDDGAQALLLLSMGLNHRFGLGSDDDDQGMTRRLAAWHEQIPDSALQPIVAAMHVKATAWRARGRGFSSTVTPEGRRLFNERNQRAWNILMDSEQRSSSVPLWYAEAIEVGGSLGMRGSQLRELFEAGIRKHPGDQAIYSSYMRHFAPLWGGDWQSADTFIVGQSAGKSNKEGEILYARLYWFVDHSNNRSSVFFQESLVKWPRMRRGFEHLMARYPHGVRSHARFASFACRANDAATYLRLRPNIDHGEFADVAPAGVSVDVCDARFKTAAPDVSSRRAPAVVQWVPPPGGRLQPLLLGRSLFENEKFEELEAVVGNYVRSDARAEDGTQELWYLTYGMDTWLQSDGIDDRRMASSLAAWQRLIPESTLQPIVAAMVARASAWRARGGGYSSTVAPEGQHLFTERNQRAWKILMDNEASSSANPMWYHQALYIGGDLGIPKARLRELFDEGLTKHPDYYALYSAYMRLFAPIWGGNWKTADQVITERSATKSNEDGDILYARLYWYVDEFNARAPGFFEESLADWSRMRRGFERLMAAYPKGARNHAAFAAFACRANDAATYTRLRPAIDRGYFNEVAPREVSVDMCDARLQEAAIGTSK